MTAKTEALSVIGGLAAGAGLMYVLDPDRGRHRRARLRRQAHRASRKLGAAAETVRDYVPAKLFAARLFS
jgi:hypothetical protein